MYFFIMYFFRVVPLCIFQGHRRTHEDQIALAPPHATVIITLDATTRLLPLASVIFASMRYVPAGTVEGIELRLIVYDSCAPALSFNVLVNFPGNRIVLPVLAAITKCGMLRTLEAIRPAQHHLTQCNKITAKEKQ
jgi:hypothetical protein